nr:immunoglobulin light chain junction region [Macaca mulatta]MOX84727.1 immunoglobulin light chain junction region [Macaca mulatta]MOX85200.1 immunoglobulin light chain junction region [Macaca mulatta]MOX85352.1 immunoglobulin light chain junction region [Macaca mulatta]MOX85458.1 immunoglobulin light chain junction region [Macaca mulatta]
CLQFTNDPFTF